MTDVTMTLQRFEYLINRDKLLSALEAGGVDNWEWYGESTREYYRGILTEETKEIYLKEFLDEDEEESKDA